MVVANGPLGVIPISQTNYRLMFVLSVAGEEGFK
jgi:hypothetical protein